MRRLMVTLLGLLSGCAGAYSQDPSGGATIKPGLGIGIPTLKSVKQQRLVSEQGRSGSGFVKQLTIESFGYGLSPTGQGFEFPPEAYGRRVRVTRTGVPFLSFTSDIGPNTVYAAAIWRSSNLVHVARPSRDTYRLRRRKCVEARQHADSTKPPGYVVQ
jgi:hypothetical protein